MNRWHRAGQRGILLSMGWLCTLAVGCMHHKNTVVPMPPVGSVPTELTMVNLPTYVIGASDILLIDVFLPPKEVLDPPVALWPQPISGQHVVKMDGTVHLGTWGSVPVVGLTVDQAADAIRQHVFDRIRTRPDINRQLEEAAKDKDGKKERAIQLVDKAEKLLVSVDVFTYNTQSYFIITDGAGYGEQIYQFPITGNDTVLKALSNINGLPMVASKRQIWVARRTPHMGMPQQLLPVDYVGITQHGVTATNYQLFPGDRIYVRAEKVFRVDGFLQKVLTPVERILGVTLLGSSTVNSITGRNLGGNQP